MDQPRRSIVKAITWRVIAFVVTILAIYIYSKDLKESLIVGISANLIKIFLYYIHERLWNKSNYGRVKPPEYQI
tara:strand:+ start:280 stop:501 length:222 start_codon:yes stop_codon:yes gene_type:complete